MNLIVVYLEWFEQIYYIFTRLYEENLIISHSSDFLLSVKKKTELNVVKLKKQRQLSSNRIIERRVLNSMARDDVEVRARDACVWHNTPRVKPVIFSYPVIRVHLIFYRQILYERPLCLPQTRSFGLLSNYVSVFVGLLAHEFPGLLCSFLIRKQSQHLNR